MNLWKMDSPNFVEFEDKIFWEEKVIGNSYLKGNAKLITLSFIWHLPESIRHYKGKNQFFLLMVVTPPHTHSPQRDNL